MYRSREHKGTVAQKMCDMPHAILLSEGTLRSLLLLTISPENVLRAHANYNYAAAGAAGVAGTARKMDIVLSVPSRRRMAWGMSHLILKDGATLSYIYSIN